MEYPEVVKCIATMGRLGEINTVSLRLADTKLQIAILLAQQTLGLLA